MPKVNIVLDKDIKEALESLVEKGDRSRVINEALRKELLNMRRRRLAKELEELRKKTKPVSTREISALIRRERSR